MRSLKIAHIPIPTDMEDSMISLRIPQHILDRIKSKCGENKPFKNKTEFILKTIETYLHLEGASFGAITDELELHPLITTLFSPSDERDRAIIMITNPGERAMKTVLETYVDEFEKFAEKNPLVWAMSYNHKKYENNLPRHARILYYKEDFLNNVVSQTTIISRFNKCALVSNLLAARRAAFFTDDEEIANNHFKIIFGLIAFGLLTEGIIVGPNMNEETFRDLNKVDDKTLVNKGTLEQICSILKNQTKQKGERK